MTKQARLYAIKELVSTQAVKSQADLREALRRRGFDVTQATLSRDLKELGVSTVMSGGKRVYALHVGAEMQGLKPLVGAEVVAINANESLVVIQTLPGCAAPVGEYIDILKNRDIIGTVAGDNTVLVIPQSAQRTAKIVQFLKQKLVEGTQ